MLLQPSNLARAAQRAAATLLALFGVSAGAVCGFAAESEGRFAPVVRPSEGDAITVSKKEFEAIKSSRDPALQPKGDVPRLSPSDLSTGMSGIGGLPATKPVDPKEKKSANWLVDAMEKKPSTDRSRSSRGSADRERDATGDRDDPTRTPLEAALKDGTNPDRESDADAKQENDRKTTTVVNPLDRYLAGWMSPGDYALLKPGLTESANGGRTGGKDALSSLPQVSGSTSLPGANAISGLVPGAPIALAPPPPPKNNPYLEILNAPAPAPIVAATYTPPPVVTPAPKVPVFAAPPPPVAPNPSKIPDFVKPAQDEKYYKQLKRF